MALNISAWSIRNPLPSIVFSIILLLLGDTSMGAVGHVPLIDILRGTGVNIGKRDYLGPRPT